MTLTSNEDMESYQDDSDSDRDDDFSDSGMKWGPQMRLQKKLDFFFLQVTNLQKVCLWEVSNSYRMSARGAWIGTTSARGNLNSKRR